MQAINLIVGLGNPGEQYRHTRHNAGAYLVELLAAASGSTLKTSKKFHGEYAIANYQQQTYYLLIPNTYMNNSGDSVKAIQQYYNIIPPAILVIHDELDLAPGVARIKFAGGSGGHNGLKSIITQLDSQQFHRLRLGIGHPGNSNLVTSYVLATPNTAELALLKQAMATTQAVLPHLITGDIATAQQLLHRT
jgi:PTH1 family peptidyl-tRNA hydrolase